MADGEMTERDLSSKPVNIDDAWRDFLQNTASDRSTWEAFQYAWVVRGELDPTWEQLKEQCQALWRTDVTLVCQRLKGHAGVHSCGRHTWNGECDRGSANETLEHSTLRLIWDTPGDKFANDSEWMHWVRYQVGKALHPESSEEPSEQLPTETGLRPGELAQLRRIDAAARFYVDSVKPGRGVAWENLMNALFDGRPVETDGFVCKCGERHVLGDGHVCRDGWKCATCGYENPRGVLRCQNLNCAAMTGEHIHQWHPDGYCITCPMRQTKASEPIYECCNDACPWRGAESETVTPKHQPDHLLCPECHEVVERV